MSWAGHVACMGEMRSVHKVLVRKPEGKKSLTRPRNRQEDNIRMDQLQALVNMVMNIKVP